MAHYSFAPPASRLPFPVRISPYVWRCSLSLVCFSPWQSSHATCHMPHAACQPHASREIKCQTSCPSVSFLGSFMHLFAFACHRHHHHHHHHPHSLLLGARLTDDITVHTPPYPYTLLGRLARLYIRCQNPARLGCFLVSYTPSVRSVTNSRVASHRVALHLLLLYLLLTCIAR